MPLTRGGAKDSDNLGNYRVCVLHWDDIHKKFGRVTYMKEGAIVFIPKNKAIHDVSMQPDLDAAKIRVIIKNTNCRMVRAGSKTMTIRIAVGKHMQRVHECFEDLASIDAVDHKLQKCMLCGERDGAAMCVVCKMWSHHDCAHGCDLKTVSPAPEIARTTLILATSPTGVLRATTKNIPMCVLCTAWLY